MRIIGSEHRVDIGQARMRRHAAGVLAVEDQPSRLGETACQRLVPEAEPATRAARIVAPDEGELLASLRDQMLRDSDYTYYVPTLYVGAVVVLKGPELGVPPEEIERSRRMMACRNSTFRRAMEAGLTVGFGTDAGVFDHGENVKEFKLRVDNGQTELDAIVSATSVSATIMGMSCRRRRTRSAISRCWAAGRGLLLGWARSP